MEISTHKSSRIGGNAVMVTEDTQAPTITYEILDEDVFLSLDNSIVRGEYTLNIETSEMLNDSQS